MTQTRPGAQPASGRLRFASANPDSIFKQPPSFSRCICIRVIRPMRLAEKVRGRAGRREVQRTRGKFRKKTRKSAFSPASRARCLRLSSAAPPVAQVSIHRFELWQRLAVWHGVTALPAKESGDAIRGAGTLQLQPPRFGRACCTRARPPLSGPASCRLLKRPRLDRPGRRMRPAHARGDKLAKGFICKDRDLFRAIPRG